MKMKSILSIVAVLTVISALSTQAQSTTPIPYANGGATNAVNYVTAPGTNTYSIACSEFDTLPIVTSIKGSGASTSTVQLYAYRSLNSTTFETVPIYSALITMNGTTPVVTMTNLNVQGAAVLRFEVGNTNASVSLTNLIVMTRGKAPKRSVFSAQP